MGDARGAQSGKSWLRGLAVVGVLAATALVPDAAHAASTLTLTAPDEVLEGENIPLRYSGEANEARPGQRRLKAFAVPASAGEACPDPRSYSGNLMGGSGSSIQDGPYSIESNYSGQDPAVLRLCAFLFESTDYESRIIAQDSRLVTIRIPRLALSLSVPGPLTAPATFSLKATASAEATRRASIGIVPDGGAGCPANAAAMLQALQVGNVSQEVTGGPVTLMGSVRQLAAGRYLACGYFHRRSESDPPQLMAAGVAFEVAAPPCVVPKLVDRKVTPFTPSVKGQVAQWLTKAGCTLGQIVIREDRRNPPNVITAASLSGTHPRGTAVDVVVSLGRLCRVPRVTGKSLAAAKRAIAKSGCKLFRVKRANSARVPSGKVISVTPRRRAKPYPALQRIILVVSRG